MKTLRIFLTISLLLAFTTADACYSPAYYAGNELIYRVLPDVSPYYSYDTGVASFSENKWNFNEENIHLWAKQTGGALSEQLLADFLYGDRVILNGDTLNATPEVRAFFDYLQMAREISAVRKITADPWYYPASRDKSTEFGQLEGIIQRCQTYRGPLRNRHVLQALRCMNALQHYDDAVNFWHSVEGDMDDDVVRTMALREAAAAIYKTGDKDTAAEIYASVGDISSLRVVKKTSLIDELQYVYEHNPNSPYFPEILQVLLTHYDGYYLGSYRCSSFQTDCEQILRLSQLCQRVLGEGRVQNPALWNYTLAALLDARGCTSEALQQLTKGEKMKRSEFLDSSYRILRMFLEAKLSNLDGRYEKKLSKDLRWLSDIADSRLTKEKREELNGVSAYWYPDTYFWNDAMRRIVFCVLCPRYQAQGRTTRALQLANYADNRMFRALGRTDMYDKDYEFNCHDYSNGMFNMTDSLSASQIEEYYRWSAGSHSALDRTLKAGSNLSQSYWADIIGTHYIRENNYKKAVEWLAKVSVDYQKQMNVYPYLDRDPFDCDFTWSTAHRQHLDTKENYKLNYAREMLRLERELAHTPLGQEYAELELRYSTGLLNQEFWCWPLTRYYDTCAFNPDRSWSYENYGPYFFQRENQRRDNLRWNVSERQEHALSLMTDNEVKAHYLRRWGYYQQVLISCPETAVASEIRLNCDEWRDYCPL